MNNFLKKQLNLLNSTVEEIRATIFNHCFDITDIERLNFEFKLVKNNVKRILKKYHEKIELMIFDFKKDGNQND